MDPSSVDQLTNTNNTPTTANPQNSVTNPGASSASDFQSTASNEILSQNIDNLSVVRTGEPLPPAAEQTASYTGPIIWGVGIVLVIVIAVIIVKVLREDESEEEGAVEKAPAAPVDKRPTVKKKASSKKKSAPNKRRKKNSKKR